MPTITLATVRLALMESTARIPSIIVPFSILVVTATFALAFHFDDPCVRGRCLNSPGSYSCLYENVNNCGRLIIQDRCFSNSFGESRPFCILLRPCWKGNMSVLNFCAAVCVLGFIIIFAFFLCWLLYPVQLTTTGNGWAVGPQQQLHTMMHIMMVSYRPHELWHGTPVSYIRFLLCVHVTSKFLIAPASISRPATDLYTTTPLFALFVFVRNMNFTHWWNFCY